MQNSQVENVHEMQFMSKLQFMNELPLFFLPRAEAILYSLSKET